MLGVIVVKKSKVAEKGVIVLLFFHSFNAIFYV